MFPPADLKSQEWKFFIYHVQLIQIEAFLQVSITDG